MGSSARRRKRNRKLRSSSKATETGVLRKSGNEVNSNDAHRGKQVCSKTPNAPSLGYTFQEGRVFALPNAGTKLQFLVRRWYSPPALLCWICLISSILGVWWNLEYPYVTLVVAVFWRLMYNGGLGLLLKWQSSSGFLTRYMEKVRSDQSRWDNRALSFCLRQTMPDSTEVVNNPSLPSAYPAWILFRCVVNLLELNDFVCLFLMALQYGLVHRPGSDDRTAVKAMLWSFADVLGSIIIIISVYTNFYAHRSTGDYGWYWGDFFFLRTGGQRNQLSFDGVFELFPHPMYTIGYAWTYGFALLARSSVVLACVMAFHTSQLLFLMIVESPHVAQLYSERSRDDASASKGTLPEKLGIYARFPQLQLPTFDVFNGYSVNLVLMLLFFVAGIQLGAVQDGPLDSDAFFLGNFVLWRALAFFVEALVLIRQEKSRFWTKSFQARGLSKEEAFASWKRLVTSFSSLQYMSFVMAAIRVAGFPRAYEHWLDVLNAEYLSQILLGFLLLAISAWSILSCYEVLGEYGWYYGDFFLPPPKSLKLTTRISPQEAKEIYNTSGSSADVSQSDVSQSESEHDDWQRPSRNSLDTRSSSIRRVSSFPALNSDSDSTPLNFISEERDPIGTSNNRATSPMASSQPTYQGIYRYLNNPEAYLGHLWMYGLAVLGSSWDLLFIVLLSHAIKIVFLQAVEKPHVRVVYKHHVRQYGSALSRVAKGKIKNLKEHEVSLFLANWVKSPRETGALAPSSRQLARAMVDTMYIKEGCVVLELGPGTGPFTREILMRMRNHVQSTYIGFELSSQFIDKLRSLFPDHADCFIQESAENIGSVLETRNIKYADTIISGLPWAIFPSSLQRAILGAIFAALRPGGRFCTFAYLQGLLLPAGQNFRGLLENVFDKVERSPVVWKNFPPAFVYRCQKA